MKVCGEVFYGKKKTSCGIKTGFCTTCDSVNLISCCAHLIVSSLFLAPQHEYHCILLTEKICILHVYTLIKLRLIKFVTNRMTVVFFKISKTDVASYKTPIKYNICFNNSRETKNFKLLQ